jgi:hypothetical protein
MWTATVTCSCIGSCGTVEILTPRLVLDALEGLTRGGSGRRGAALEAPRGHENAPVKPGAAWCDLV